jgi:hypothetical protein
LLYFAAVSQPTDPQKVDLAQFASVDDAIEKAQESCAGLAPLAKRIIQVRQGTIYQSTIFMLSAIARAEGLARGVIYAVRTETPM